MKSIKNKLRQLWQDESAQGTTEYILLLVIVVAIAFIFKDRIKEAVTSKLGEVSQSIQGFSGE